MQKSSYLLRESATSDTVVKLKTYTLHSYALKILFIKVIILT